ncbi:MAG: TonB-dependent receptor [Deltaproteobacteria bacterium]|nr:TonB-dependent receptor [Deltaproteobacteria bacterium]
MRVPRRRLARDGRRWFEIAVCATCLLAGVALAHAAAQPPDRAKRERSKPKPRGEQRRALALAMRSAPLFRLTVKARRSDKPDEDSAAAASVITRERTPRSAETTTELLDQLPGVTLTRSGGIGALATLSLRGSTADQVGVYLDGIPLNTAVGGGVDVGLLPIGAMERVEVYRGVTPVAFGGTAIGGIVSLSGRVPDRDSASAEVGGGSFETAFGAAEATATTGRLSMLASAHVIRSAGNFSYASDNGTAFDARDDRIVVRRNNEMHQIDGSARLVYRLSPGRRLMASVWLLHRLQGLPGDGLYQASRAELRTQRLIGALHYRARGLLGRASRLRARLWSVVVRQRLDDPLAEIGLGTKLTNDKTLRVGAAVDANRRVTDWLRFSVVLDGRFERFSPHNALSPERSAAASDRGFLAAGTEALVWIDAWRLKLQPSLRFEFANDRINAPDRPSGQAVEERQETTLAPVVRFSVVQNPSDWLAIKANFGRYYRLPSLRERFGNTGFFLGNPDLRPEVGINADLGLVVEQRWRSTKLRGELSAFAAWVDDLIQLEQSAYLVRAANLDRARLLGLESAVSLQIWRYVHLVSQLTFTDSRDTSEIAARRGKHLPLRPRVRAVLRPELRAWPLGSRLAAGAFVELKYTAGNHTDPANLVLLPSRLLLGSGVHLDIKPAGLRLTLTARNITGAQQLDFLGYPLPGRSFFFTLQWSSGPFAGDSNASS